jgi:microcystin-dependent protein
MSTPFLAEIRIVSFNFAPKGWAQCNGQLLPINQNQPLFALLGTTFGGDGRTNFALPNLRGRAPIHTGGTIGATLGQAGGEEAHTLTISEMPTHLHTMQANVVPNPADQANATPNMFGLLTSALYGPPSGLVSSQPASVTSVGGSQPHTNMQPYSVLNMCIALQGIFPSQT